MSAANSKLKGMDWLQNWYVRHCDGDWEHRYGLKLGTLDNPGWNLAIDLMDTELQDRPFPSIEIDRTEQDWLRCSVQNHQFYAVGGAGNLIEMIRAFQCWAEPDVECDERHSEH